MYIALVEISKYKHYGVLSEEITYSVIDEFENDERDEIQELAFDSTVYLNIDDVLEDVITFDEIGHRNNPFIHCKWYREYFFSDMSIEEYARISKLLMEAGDFITAKDSAEALLIAIQKYKHDDSKTVFAFKCDV